MGKKRTYKALSVAAGPSMKSCKTRKLTSEILKEAYAQRIEVEDEEITKTIPMRAFFKQAVSGFEDLIYDDNVNEQFDEFQSEVLDNQDEDNKLLDALFHKDGASIAKRLSDTITSFKEFEEDKDFATGSACLSETVAIDYYQRLGKFMSLYTHGKMPKALSQATRQENWWIPLRKFSQPELWSPSAMYKATNMFASSSKSQRFFELFLLSRSGTCTNEEAVIIGSVMQKVSIPQKFSCFALVCLAGMESRGTTSYFIKVILEKKYALAHGAIDAVAAHFLRFHNESEVMPTIWHQTLLSFVQLYKHELRRDDKKSLASLLDKQFKKHITPEILRELESSRNRGEKEITISHSASTNNNNKPIKEDLFDMPQVPMEED